MKAVLVCLCNMNKKEGIRTTYVYCEKGLSFNIWVLCSPIAQHESPPTLHSGQNLVKKGPHKIIFKNFVQDCQILVSQRCSFTLRYQFKSSCPQHVMAKLLDTFLNWLLFNKQFITFQPIKLSKQELTKSSDAMCSGI